MFDALFFCLGFCVAILYIDLVFDVSALPYRKTGAALPAQVLDPITTYYRYVTRNPWLLIYVMTVAVTCIVVELVLRLVPSWVGYSSLAIFGVTAVLAVARVIPGAQRLASSGETAENKTRLVHGVLFYHLAFLVLLLTLAILQSSAPRL